MEGETILIVEPDPDNGTLLKSILINEGYQAITAFSLDEAIQLLVISRFDLIVTEAFGQHKYYTFDPTFLQELRKATHGTPIILYSTYVSTDDIREGNFDLAGVMPKPCDIDALLGKVNEILSNS